jgi:hypothetical protein
MPVPFGIGIGDFIAVSALIAKIASELKKVQRQPRVMYRIMG